jgi:chromosome segregation ATPase
MLSRSRAEADAAAAEATDFRERLEIKARELMDANRERSELEQRLAAARRQAEQVGADVVEHRQRLERREQELSAVRRELNDRGEELDRARENIGLLGRQAAEKEKIAVGLRDHIFVLKEDLERQQSATANLEAERDEALRAASDRIEEQERLKAEAEAAREGLSAEMRKIKAEAERIVAERVAELQGLQAERDRAVADRISAERKLWDRFDEIATLTRLLQEKEKGRGADAQEKQDQKGQTIPGLSETPLSRFLPRRLRVAYQVKQLRKSGIFDPEWYVGYYEDIARAGVDPYRHFILHGAAEGRSPNAKWERGER